MDVFGSLEELNLPRSLETIEEERLSAWESPSSFLRCDLVEKARVCSRVGEYEMTVGANKCEYEMGEASENCKVQSLSVQNIPLPTKLKHKMDGILQILLE